MELAILNQKGEDTGRKAVLNDEVFGIVPNEHAVYLDVKQYLANQRQGTHKAKERSEVAGSTRKLHKQKGGGGSRVGDINSPVLRGGGRVFGPRPRDYSFKLNKKTKQLARRSALSAKAADGQIIILDTLTLEEPRTRLMTQVTRDLKVEGRKLLLVLPQRDDRVVLAARNIPGIQMIAPQDLNTYAVLNNAAIIMAEGALDIVNNL